MKSLWVAVLLLLVLVADGFIFATNPLHVPEGYVPARLLGLQSFQELDPSMEPTLPEKRSLLVSAWPYWHADPRPGDIVAFVYPPDHSQADVKRVIAVARSTVEIRNSVVPVDGKVIAEPYLLGIRGLHHPQAVHPPGGDCVDSRFALAHRYGVTRS
jgi:signal peptidase S26 family